MDPVVELAAAGVPTAAIWTANDSDVLTAPGDRDLSAAIAAAREELHRRGQAERRAASKDARARQELADRVLSKGGHELLARIHEKLTSYGIQLPSVRVDFRDVQVTTEALFGSTGVPTVGSIPLNLAKRMLGLGGERTCTLSVLGGAGGAISGVLRPGRSTLLLGPPGCGKTTLMRVLANRLKGCEALDVKGQVHYNGHTKDECVVERVVAFAEQVDNHLGALTVEETLSFAYTCQEGKAPPPFDVHGRMLEAKAQQSLIELRSPHQPASQPPASPAPNRTARRHGDSAPGAAIGGSGGERGADARVAQLRGAARARLEEDEVEALIRGLLSGGAVRMELIMRWMGLAHVRHGMVGDAMTRGLSGGERKRLTCAEMLVAHRHVLLLDEINTGLDAATLHSVIAFLALMTRGLQLTTLISLLQPSPEVVGLFDDIMLMAEGAILYHGPVSDVLPHFEALGFVCPPRKDIASFLQELSTPAGQLVHAVPALRARLGGVVLQRASAGGVPSLEGVRAPEGLLVPIAEMSDYFKAHCQHGIQQQAALAAGPFPKGQSHPDALPKRRYALTPWQAAGFVTRRQLLLVLRDRVLLRGRIIQVIVMGLIVGSLYFQMGTTLADARSRLGASFLVLMFVSFGGMIQVAVVMVSKGSNLKQRDAGFYPAWTQGVAMTLSQLPLTLLEVVLFGSIVYWMLGYVAEAGAFFTFLLILGCASLCLSSMFRLMAVWVPTPTLMNAVAGILLLCLIMTSGFAIVRQSIHPWWIWAYWISPFSWALRGIAVNEFMTGKWDIPVSAQAPGLSIGAAALDTFGLYHERFWIWAGVGYLLGMLLVFGALLCWVLGFVTGGSRRAQVPDPEEVAVQRRAATKLRAKVDKALASASGAPASKRGAAPAAAPAEAASAPQATVSQPQSPQAGAEQVEAVIQLRDDQAPAPLQPGEAVRLSMLPGAGSPQAQAGSAGVRSGALGDGAGDTGSLLPFQQVTLAFRDVHYFVPNPAFDKKAAKAAAKQAAGGGKHASAVGGLSEARAAGARRGAPLAVDSLGSASAASSLDAGGRRRSGSLYDVEAASLPDGATDIELEPELELLKGITGYVLPGQLMALMGGSGAGKTTLSDVLCGRKTIGRITGDILVNGHPKQQDTWARVVGYVEQTDVHTAAATVLEALWFAARLRLPPSVPDATVKGLCADVLDMVELMPLAHSLVGDASAPASGGLSGEQRKRLTIAVELAANPSVLFLDEPTSGLDARSAAVVMRAIRNVASSGRTVAVVIHQPSIEIFEAFDSLLLLQRGGRTSYFGPLGHESTTLASYLERVPGTAPLKPGVNPATWMLEVTGGSMSTVAAANNVDWPALYAASPEAEAAAAEVVRLGAQGRASSAALALAGKYAQPFGVQMRELLRKYRTVWWRMPSYNLSRLLLTFVVSWIYATNYLHVGVMPVPASIANVQNVLGVLFSSASFMGMTNLMATMPVVAAERLVFYRESGSATYSVFPYGFALALVELPWILAQVCIFVPIVYFLIGFQPTAEAFFHYFVMTTLVLYYYIVFGQFLTWATPSQQLAQVAGSSVNFIMQMVNGFTIAYPSIPPYWQWVNRLVPVTWVLYGIAAAQLGNVTSPLVVPGAEPTTVQRFLEQVFDYHYSLRWWAVAIVAANMVAYRVASILVLRYKNYLRR